MDAFTVRSGGPRLTERDLAIEKRVISGEGPMYLLTAPRFASSTLTQSIRQSSKVCLSGFDGGAPKKIRLGSCVMGGHYPVRVVEQ